MRYTFNDYELRLDTFELSGPEGRIHVEPQVFDVLALLVRHRERVVTKTEILDEVWESRFVSESALTSRIKDLRIALGDSGRAQHTVRTVHGKGYQFIAAVTEKEAGVETSGRRELPRFTNRFLGRNRELADLASRLDEGRLVTILGPGGTGKTRLSAEHAQSALGADGAAFVDLAAVRDEHAVGQALAAALGIDPGVNDDVVDACCEYLRARPVLVVMDNCEHVVGASAELVDRVLSNTTTTSVLATSRVPLGVRDEVLFRLQPLPVLVDTEDLTPDDAMANAAVGLFVDRVGRVTDDFVLDASSLPNVVALCHALDGLPLAIELAASRMGVFGLDDLVARLDRRLDLLGDDSVGAESRHRTLRATLEWSYELLEPEAQRLFRFLSVFPGGLCLDGVEWLGHRVELTADPLMTLNTLVEASLLGRGRTPSGTRYAQLETMRTYGLDLLEAAGEREAALDGLADWSVHLSGLAEAGVTSAQESWWDDRLRREMANMREARSHLRNSARIDDLVSLSAGLYEWAMLRDASELWQWSDEITALGPLGASTHRATAVQALALWRRGRIDEAAEQATAILAADDADPWSVARAYSARAAANLFKGNFEAASEAWAARVEVQPDYNIDAASAALTDAYAGRVAEAREALARIRPRAEASGWPSEQAWVEYITGEVEWVAGETSSVGWLQRAVDRAGAAGTQFIVGVAGLTLCTTVQAQGDLREAAHRYRDLIEHWLRSGSWSQQWTTLRNAASLVERYDPGLALLVLETANRDPLAPVVDDSPDGEDSLRRSNLRVILGPEAAAEIDATVIDRAELATQVRTSLRAFLDGAPGTDAGTVEDVLP